MKRIISILLLSSAIILAACESGEPSDYSVPEKYEVSRDEVKHLTNGSYTVNVYKEYNPNNIK